MKRIFSLLLACLTLLCLSLPVFADVIYEPENSFFESHRDECRSHYPYRAFQANGQDGYIFLYKSPDSDVRLQAIPNGESFAVDWYYTDSQGTIWLLVQSGEGWIKDEDCRIVYDSTQFLKDHADEIKTLDEAPDVSHFTGKEITLWSYPCGTPYDFRPEDKTLLTYVREVYTDPMGNEWGYITYYMGIRQCWVLLSDPGATELENVQGDASLLVIPADSPALEPLIPASAKIPALTNQSHILLWVGGSVVLLAAVTYVLIRVLFRKDKKQQTH